MDQSPRGTTTKKSCPQMTQCEVDCLKNNDEIIPANNFSECSVIILSEYLNNLPSVEDF